ncbi:MAG: HesA/MoeB/ThiF family protein [Prolixibacteraceae bacterium]|nr:HesA/MoeB/ThiF family protein [Prolixibacteraceae bacterium]MBN2649475.1 HesA/MoeB/ThiF family protein [Prolixibacteraceae bacterium]
MNKNELNRYARQTMLPQIGTTGQAKIRQAKVLVVGAGGLGAPVLQYLTAAGVGTIGIVDNDTVSETNLQRQVLYSTEDIDLPKAEIACEKLLKLNPYCNIQTYNERLDEKNASEIVRKFDLVVDCTDNFTSRYLLDDVCEKLEKPLVYGSIEEFSGQISVFHYDKSFSYKKLFPEKPEDKRTNGEPLGVFSAIPGVIGSLQATEVLKIITGAGDVLSGRLLLYDALKSGFKAVSFS